jgi:hypothetical protein
MYLFVVIMEIRGKAAIWRWEGCILQIIQKSINATLHAACICRASNLSHASTEEWLLERHKHSRYTAEETYLYWSETYK